MRVGDVSAPLKVVSSERRRDPDELVTYATGPVPAALIERLRRRRQPFDDDRDAQRASLATAIRLGNTGAQQNLPRLTAACGKAIGNRADLVAKKTGGSAAAK